MRDPDPAKGREDGQEVIRLSFMNAWELFKTVRKRQEGQTMTEYAIVLSLVAVVVIAAVAALGSRITAVLTSVTSKF
jgi:Flp pilus assembly pilin Flp